MQPGTCGSCSSPTRKPATRASRPRPPRAVRSVGRSKSRDRSRRFPSRNITADPGRTLLGSKEGSEERAERAPARMLPMSAPIRTVQVHPPSRHGEAVAVLRAVATILFGALLVIMLRSGAGGFGPGGGLRAGDLQSFQRLFGAVDPELQRAYRELQEGLIEAENSRVEAGTWPAPEALAAQGVPPFAADPTRKVRYAWSLSRDGLCVSYRGIPASAVAPELLAWIQEPAPGYGETIDPKAPRDEVHHRLSDGTVLHVSIWFRPPGSTPAGTVAEPLKAGFLQILAGTPPGK